MILATPDDYEFPHIDWKCKECGMVYCSAGYPPETRCLNGHGAGWRPENEQLFEYIDLLETLEPGNGIVISGDGPATLMGPVESVDDNQLVTAMIDSSSRTLRWERDDSDPTIEWKQTEKPDAFYDDVHHVETVEIQTAADKEVPA
ncbi:hypothetical protein [Natrialba asiatica]|uniref:Uncharacterized protein n=1 Tax=Natrialba asiatica (strain ATCC 700177 / DSM 12278 / JCM 9576 / FERM P-10747 / NBRC 102637 / 172P1) TaxID=29540 RepID=M0AHD6_NATA1|nr:hypothetical protein [Natrialba asiatica]ELY97317.1 hypothetical protein C481_20521 [Natrialba asiatica DSM 12278]